MAYKIEVDEVGNYIEYLRKFKKKLESELLQFEKDLKNAHEFWDDNNYEETIKAKEIVAKEHKKLIDAIETSRLFLLSTILVTDSKILLEESITGRISLATEAKSNVPEKSGFVVVGNVLIIFLFIIYLLKSICFTLYKR